MSDLDLSSIEQRWLIYDDDDSDEPVLDAAMACADDIPALVAEVKRLREEAKAREELRIRQLAAISTAALGYLKKNEKIEDCLWTAALHDVMNLYEKYNRLHVNERWTKADALEEAAKIARTYGDMAYMRGASSAGGVCMDIEREIRALKTNKGAQA